MPEFVTIEDILLPSPYLAAALPIPVDIASGFPFVPAYRLTGGAVSPIVLAGDLVISPQGVPTNNQKVTFYNEVDYTLAGFDVIIFGVIMPTSLALTNFKVESIYNNISATWTTSYYIGLDQSAWIQTADIGLLQVTTGTIADLAITTVKIADEAVTNAKMAQMAKTTVKGNDSGVTAVPHNLTMTDLRTILAQAITFTGDIATGPIAQTYGTGVFTIAITIANNAITTAKILDANVTSAKLEAALKVEVVTFTIDFTDFGTFNFSLPFVCTVVNVRTSCIRNSSGAGNGTLQLQWNSLGAAMTPSPMVTLSSADTVGASQLITALTNNTTVTADDSIAVAIADSGGITGGTYLVSLKVTRT